MKFEVAALGRPAILLAASDDQLPVGPPFASTGAALWLGDGRTIEPEAARDAVARLLADDARRAAMSAAGRRVVDGAGADRLAAEIAALAEGQMSAS
jgi:UDP-N-acetylglucosamine:LPS N-acetylglucosamine transferase